MNSARINRVLIILFFCFSCKSDQTNQSASANERIYGLWRYDDNPNSYIEITKEKYVEYLGEINSRIVCSMNWQDSMHYILNVKETSGVITQTIKVGDKLKVVIIELKSNLLRFKFPDMEIQPVIGLTRQSK